MDKYSSPETGGLGGVERFKNANKLSKREALSILRRLDAYTLHRQVNTRKFKRRRIIAFGVNDIWQMDLVDFSKYKRFNKGYRYVLVVVDSLSRYVRALPLKKKRPEEVKRALARMFRDDGVKPRRIFSDKGGEFHSRLLRTYFLKNKIHHYSNYSPYKASQCERFNRTLRERIFRHFRSSGSFRYLSVLPRIIQDYNSTRHTVTGIAPRDVNKENEVDIFIRVNAKRTSYSSKKSSKSAIKSGFYWTKCCLKRLQLASGHLRSIKSRTCTAPIHPSPSWWTQQDAK